MHRSTWKAHERLLARFFGAERNIGSGSLGRYDRSKSDSTHPRLYLEKKVSAKRSAMMTLWEDTAAKAKAEGKIPVVSLTKLRGETLVVCRLEDLKAIAGEVKE